MVILGLKMHSKERVYPLLTRYNPLKNVRLGSLRRLRLLPIQCRALGSVLGSFPRQSGHTYYSHFKPAEVIACGLPPK